jgi:uncharacterized phiE125 gp8 family phage protein
MVVVKTESAIEPINLEESKLQLRVDFDDDDALITRMIKAAREYCEGWTGRSFVEKTLEHYLYSFPLENFIRLPHQPVTAISSVAYKDSDGVDHSMSEGTDYLDDIEGGHVVLPYSGSWPSVMLYPVNPIKINYAVGSTVPETVKQAIHLLIGHWYENREAVMVGTITKEIEFSVHALLSQHRDRWWN